MINFGIVIKVVGVVLTLTGALMLTAIPFSLHFESGDALSIIYAATITMVVGTTMWLYKRRTRAHVGKHEGFLVVACSWLGIATVGTLPYLISGTLPVMSSAFFESMSGLTTTGATVITDIESVPQGILFWRSLTQWIGGMGIIVLTVAIFPLLGIGGVELFVAESPGPVMTKIHPRVKETAKRLWLIYISLTAILTTILWSRELSFFDAINHGLTTMATGGFSTKNDSIGHFGPDIQYIILGFMFLAGVNYTIIYFGLMGRLKRVWASDEFRAYLSILGVLILAVASYLFLDKALSAEEAIRTAAFHVISVVTTTGFVTSDYTAWSPYITLLFFMMLFIGGCAGSTSGGIKVVRILVFLKNSALQYKRLLHPRAVLRVKIDKEQVPGRVLIDILVFLMAYAMLFMFGALIMTAFLTDFKDPLLTSLGAVATALGNVGPGIAEVGPVSNFAAIPVAGKWVLSLLMLLGRLELFTVLILFMPYFWTGTDRLRLSMN